LKERGLQGVRLFVSDNCLGLVSRRAVAAVHGAFLSQRVDGSADEQGEGSGGDAESHSCAGRSRRSSAEGRTSGREVEGHEASDAAEHVRTGIEETLYYYAFPREHWRSLRTNNPMERILREVRRRTRAVGAFPDGKSALMLAAARLRHVAGTKWGTRRYLDMNRLAEASEAA
jgi:transposase-like protein